MMVQNFARSLVFAVLLASLAAFVSCATTGTTKKPAGASVKKEPPGAKASPAAGKKAKPAELVATRIAGGEYELQLRSGKLVGSRGGDLPMAMDQYGMRMQTTSTYALVNPKTGKMVGTAESAITKSLVAPDGSLRAERKIEVASDGRRILVQEDTTETFPTRRYILFEQKGDGTFQTFYLAPPVDPIPEDQVIKYNYTLPWIHFGDAGFSYYPKFEMPFNR